MRFFFLSVLAFILLSGCSAPKVDDSNGNMLNSNQPILPSPASVEPVNATEWKEFASDSGKFAVVMPGAPTATASLIRTAMGDKASRDFVLITRQGDREVSYIVSYADLDVDTNQKTEDILQQSAQAAHAKLQSSVISQANTAVNGFPALDFQLKDRDLPELLTFERYVMVNSRLYELVVVLHSTLMDQGQPQKFLDSFKPTQ